MNTAVAIIIAVRCITATIDTANGGYWSATQCTNVSTEGERTREVYLDATDGQGHQWHRTLDLRFRVRRDYVQVGTERFMRGEFVVRHTERTPDGFWSHAEYHATSDVETHATAWLTFESERAY